MAGRSPSPTSRAASPTLVAVLALGMSLALAGCGSPSSPRGAPGTGGAGETGSYGPPVRVGEVADEAVVESSGVVASRANPGRLWTHNDSDDGPILYCLERDGKSCGRWRVADASARDWEDIAAGPGPRAGEPYLYVGDIGDNLQNQGKLVIYRVPDPTLAEPPATLGVTAPAEVIRLRYDDEPHDAEALLVHPTTGDIYVITKDFPAGVYKAAAGASTLARIAGVQLGGLGFVTGGDISPDGRRVALCTLSTGIELVLPETPGVSFDEIWNQPPVPVKLPRRAQGEAIAYRLDGNALVTTSELSPSPLYEVPRR